MTNMTVVMGKMMMGFQSASIHSGAECSVDFSHLCTSDGGKDDDPADLGGITCNTPFLETTKNDSE